METFGFVFHTMSFDYLDQGNRIQFGGGFEFASRPANAQRRQFNLRLPAMRFVQTDDVTPNRSTVQTAEYDPRLNLYVLQDFWLRHLTYKRFLYPIVAFGEQVTVRFNKPMTFPTAVLGGTGWVEGIEIELIEYPT
jgi:hypothetical protein